MQSAPLRCIAVATADGSGPGEWGQPLDFYRVYSDSMW